MPAASRLPRIGLVVPHLAEPGGVGALARFVKDTILATGRHDLKVISLATGVRDPCNASLTRPSTWRRGPVVSRGEWEGLPCFHVGAIVGELEFQRFRPRRVLAEVVSDCDILQVVSGVPAWANTVCGLGKPVAVQSATTIAAERKHLSNGGRGTKGWWQQKMARVIEPLDRRVLQSVDAIQVYNPWMLDLAHSLNVGRDVAIRYAPPGVDIHRYTPALSRQLGERPFLLCVGRLHDARKNVALLVEAFALLPPQLRNEARIVFAGATSPPERMWQRAEQLGVRGRIDYVAAPTQETLIELYQHATAFVLPSHEEGLGVVLLEAMACGIPVISTRSGGPEGIITDGQDGFLVPLNDAHALAEHIIALSRDRCMNDTMGRQARRTAEERYSKQATASPYVEIWDRLIEASR